MSKSHLHARTGKVTRAYCSWQSMKSRCFNKNDDGYPRYGGCGITVCERWVNSFEAFLADMGEPPTDEHTIDRFPNHAGNYEPGNCRWATKREQGQNRKTNRLITFNGETHCAAEWARRLGMPRRTLFNRLKRGWTIEKALTEPMRDYPR